MVLSCKKLLKKKDKELEKCRKALQEYHEYVLEN